ncbi:MAG: SBBP repeat-containing protein [Candidatus Aminicenantes bacterium]|nr:SBBP repeat-containing protein [Candidatus Aminicenantes bacterium]
MKKVVLVTIVCSVVFAASAVPQGRGAGPAATALVGRSADFGSLPLYFIANHGQSSDGVLFEARTSRYTLALTAQSLAFRTGRAETSRVRFAGARSDAKVSAADPADYRVNFFYGSGPDAWMTDIPTATAIVYEGLYPGVDLKVYGVERQVEYDWIVRAGADPAAIAVEIEGGRARINADGDLVVAGASDKLVHRAPVAFQDIDGRRVAVEASFERRGDAVFGFCVGPYDRTCDLVIDPYIISYSTYVGTGYKDMATAIGIDDAGAVYIAGYRYEFVEIASPPPDAYDRNDNFVTKIAPDGRSLVYTSYFSVGKPNRDWVRPDLAVDAAGNAYLVGITNSTTFPVKNALRAKYQGGDNDGFIVKIAPTGKSLVFSSYIGGGGHDAVSGVAVDAEGAVYLTGETTSANFPLAKPFQKKPASLTYLEAFLMKLAPTGKSLVFSTFLGGSAYDWGESVAVGADGAVYVTGLTGSADFPTVSAAQARKKGRRDFFISKFAADGQSLAYSTYLGGTADDYPYGIAVDRDGSAVVVGYTMGRFPVKNAFQSERRGQSEAVVAKLSPKGNSLVFSSYLAGIDTDIAYGVAVAANGVIAVTGMTESADFPVKGALQKSRKGGEDAFLTLIPATGGKVLFSTFLGGRYADSGHAVVFDTDGRILVTGWTNSTDFPFKDGCLDAFQGGRWDSFVTRYEVK